MTKAEEKAQELFTNFRFLLSLPGAPLGDNKDIIVKQCVRFCVDEISKALQEYDERTEEYLKKEFNLDYTSVELQNIDSSFRFIEKVRQELELL